LFPSLFLARRVESDGGADDILERRLVNLVAHVNVDGAANIAVEAGVEKSRGILQGSALGESELYAFLLVSPVIRSLSLVASVVAVQSVRMAER
jgi:hypothetical protein